MNGRCDSVESVLIRSREEDRSREHLKRDYLERARSSTGDRGRRAYAISAPPRPYSDAAAWPRPRLAPPRAARLECLCC